MARIQARLPAHAPAQDAPTIPTWADWFGKFQAFQVHAVRDMLTVYNRCVSALAASRDPQGVAAACQASMSDWAACVDGVQQEWFALSKAAPEDALAALGWRLKRGARDGEDGKPCESVPDFLEQSRLGVEMLLRPWAPAADLDHTDEFVA